MPKEIIDMIERLEQKYENLGDLEYLGFLKLVKDNLINEVFKLRKENNIKPPVYLLKYINDSRKNRGND